MSLSRRWFGHFVVFISCLTISINGQQTIEQSASAVADNDDNLFMSSSSMSSSSSSTTTSSYDSLISSQCKAKCLSLYPWNIDYANQQQQQQTNDANNNIDIENNEEDVVVETRVVRRRVSKRHQNLWSTLLMAPKQQQQPHSNLKRKRQKHQDGKSTLNHHHHFNNVKWHKVMELCSKNANCLQCSLPCEIPTNLLSNCKYLCKNRHPLCIESCNLLTKLSQDKQGTCPLISNDFIESSSSSSSSSTEEKCANYTLAQMRSRREGQKPPLATCTKDTDCADIGKCCSLTPACPQHGRVCTRPKLINTNIASPQHQHQHHIPSVPYNLTIVERKKGKTIILSWDCQYNKNKPTMFVVEGRWSLNSPPTDGDESSSSATMTKWGYLAQTVNTNWIILRSINRGRWYKFRVAAIAKAGTLGFSPSTPLFILSSPPKPPSQPQNLTVNKVSPSDTDQDETPQRVNVDLSWLPSKRSDLPITNYKLTWALLTQNDGGVNHGGQDLIDGAQSNLNKYTIHNLFRNSIYTIEIAAQSAHEQTMLVSTPMRITLDTKILDAYTLQLKAGNDAGVEETTATTTSHNEYEDDDDEDDEDNEDDNLDMKPMTRQSQNGEGDLPDKMPTKRPIIKNLLVQTPYFQNGLVKAKLSWQVDYNNNNNNNKESSTTVNGEASINAKTIVDQPMFTLTWFAIKCFKSSLQTRPNEAEEANANSNTVTMSQRHLPTPITATTINTHFEIYELKYNCDYVVNVKLAPPTPDTTSLSSSSSSLKRPVPPQIASTQFKVPSCSQIKLIGRIQPMCYERTNKNNGAAALINKNIYSILSTSSSSSSIISTSTLPTITTTTTDTTTTEKTLPHVYNIRYKIVNRSPQNLYAVEFTWSRPSSAYSSSSSSSSSYTGYQISVVPKAIPGFFNGGDESLGENDDNSNNFVGSISAIVDKEQNAFVVRQLRPAIRYIFQIQTINKNEPQASGPPNSLEFLIESHHQHQQQQQHSTLEQQKLLQIKIKDALRSSSSSSSSSIYESDDGDGDDDEDETIKLNSRDASTSLPSYLNNGGMGGGKFLTDLLVRSVFFVCFSFILIESRLKS